MLVELVNAALVNVEVINVLMETTQMCSFLHIMGGADRKTPIATHIHMYQIYCQT